MQNLMNPEELEKVLMDKDCLGMNALQLAIAYSNADSVRKIFSIGQNQFYSEEFDTYLQSTDYNRRNIFHFAAENNENEGIIKTVSEMLKTFMTFGEIEDLLNGLTNDGQNPIHCLLNNNKNRKALEELFKTFDEFFCSEELKNLFMEKEVSSGNNSFMIAAEKSCVECLEVLWNFTTISLNDEDIKQVLLEKNNFGQNALHSAVIFNDNNVIEKIFKISQDQLQLYEAKQFLKSFDSRGRNIFHLATVNKNEGTIKTVFGILGSSLTFDEMNSFLKQKNVDGDNVLHFAAKFSSEGSMNELWNFLESILSLKELKDLLLDFNNQISYSLHRAINFNNKEFIENFVTITKKVLTRDELKEAFGNCSTLNSNIFHYAACNKTCGIIEIVMKFLNEFVEKADVEKLIKQSEYIKNENIFHILARHNNAENLECFLKLVKNILSIETFQNLFLERNDDGKNSFQIAVSMDKKEVYRCLWKYICRYLTYSQQHKVLVSLGEKGAELASELTEYRRMFLKE